MLIELYGASHGELLKEEEEAKAKGGNEPASPRGCPELSPWCYLYRESPGDKGWPAGHYAHTVVEMTTGV